MVHPEIFISAVIPYHEGNVSVRVGFYILVKAHYIGIIGTSVIIINCRVFAVINGYVIRYRAKIRNLQIVFVEPVSSKFLSVAFADFFRSAERVGSRSALSDSFGMKNVFPSFISYGKHIVANVFHAK